jgi:hypothetical protein
MTTNKRVALRIPYEPWTPEREWEITLKLSEYDLYRRNDPACAFHSVRWPLRAGRGKHGEFPLVVVREHFRQLGYVVLASEPRLPDGEGFILVAYPGKRRSGDASYRRMEAFFGAEALANLNSRADIAKRERTGNLAGGDPDLFVFRPSNPEERFFVEVKHRDQITEKQSVTFPLIEELCPIHVARVREIQ